MKNGDDFYPNLYDDIANISSVIKHDMRNPECEPGHQEKNNNIETGLCIKYCIRLYTM